MRRRSAVPGGSVIIHRPMEPMVRARAAAITGPRGLDTRLYRNNHFSLSLPPPFPPSYHPPTSPATNHKYDALMTVGADNPERKRLIEFL